MLRHRPGLGFRRAGSWPLTHWLPSSLTWWHLQWCWADGTATCMSFLAVSCWEAWFQELSVSMESVIELVLSDTGGERVVKALAGWDFSPLGHQEVGSAGGRECCLRVVLVSSSPEHLQNGIMIKRIGKGRQLRGTGGEKGDIQEVWRETELKNFKTTGRWTGAKISGGQSTNLPEAAAFFRAATSPWTVSIASIKHGVGQPNQNVCSSLLVLHSEACSDILSSST